MLTGFGFSNYRAFRDAKLEIAPLTILVGPNGSGKTSIISLLLLMKQTLLTANKHQRGVLKLNGRIVDFGLVKNLFFGQKLNNYPRFEFQFKSAPLLHYIKTSFTALVADSIDMAFEFNYFANNAILNTEKESKSAKKFDFSQLKNDYSKQSSKNAFTTMNSKTIDEKESKNILHDFPILRDAISELNNGEISSFSGHLEFLYYRMLSPNNRSRLKRESRKALIADMTIGDATNALLLASAFISVKSNNFSVEIKLANSDKKNDLYITSFGVKSDGKFIFCVNFNAEGQASGVSSDLSDGKFLKSYLGSFSKMFNNSNNIFRILNAKILLPIGDIGPIDDFDSSNKLVTQAIFEISKISMRHLEMQFDETSLMHIGPIRSGPRRFFSFESSLSGSTETESVVDALRSTNGLLEFVNKWFAEFNINMKVASFADFSELLNRISIRRENLDLDLDLPDVGFGNYPPQFATLFSPPCQDPKTLNPWVHESH